MTKKESRIVNSAITLFAEKGFHATSTRLIAKNAEPQIAESKINKKKLLTGNNLYKKIKFYFWVVEF